MQQEAEPRTQIVRPQRNREGTLPKSQVQKSDGEEPCPEPEAPRKTVLLDFYSLHPGSIRSFQQKKNGAGRSRRAPFSAKREKRLRVPIKPPTACGALPGSRRNRYRAGTGMRARDSERRIP